MIIAKTRFQRTNSFSNNYHKLLVMPLILTFSFVFGVRGATDTSNSDDKIINQYIQSKGANIIVFDSSNIKQFWINNSVFSNNDNINISLTNSPSGKNESDPLKIQLANVRSIQDCKIEVLTDNSDVSFTIANTDSNVISTSFAEKDFILHHIVSSEFHLADAPDYTFYLKFSSDVQNLLSVKKIILSFSANKDFLASPGHLHVSKEVLVDNKNLLTKVDENSFSIKGKRCRVMPQKNILVSDNTVSVSVTIKNIGHNPTVAYFGYESYTISGKKIGKRNIPYNNTNQVLEVVSSAPNDNKLIVNSYPEWATGCYLAVNAKEDLSDFPDIMFLENKITAVNKLENGNAEIVFDKRITSPIAKGTHVRIQSPVGASYIYMNTKELQPNEEVTFISNIKKDDTFFQYSSKAFCRGVYYVKPVILSISDDEDNTILVSDWSISY